MDEGWITPRHRNKQLKTGNMSDPNANNPWSSLDSLEKPNFDYGTSSTPSTEGGRNSSIRGGYVGSRTNPYQSSTPKDQPNKKPDEVEKPTLTNHEERWLLKLLNEDEGFQITTEYFKDSELTGRQIFIILLNKVSVMGQKHFNDKRAVLARKL